MPVYSLKIKAELEEIAKMSVTEGVMWKFDIQSGEGGDSKSGITVTASDVMELDGSKGEANFIVKWPGSKMQSYIKVLETKAGAAEYTAEKSGEWVTIANFECRGLEIVSYIPGADFKAESTGGTIFEAVDLSEGDWAEYDEENELAVSIMNLEHMVMKA